MDNEIAGRQLQSCGDFQPDHLTVFQDKLYMSGDTGDGNGPRTLSTDDTGIVRMTNIGAGSTDGLYNYDEVVAAGNNLYLTSSQNALIRFDGTAATNIASGYVYGLTSYNDVLHL